MAFASNCKILEQAKEDLRLLEIQHPNHFSYLKLELNSLIFLLESKPCPLDYNKMFCSSLSANYIAATQAASTCECGREKDYHWFHDLGGKDQRSCRRDRVDVVLERAQSCLAKLQELKLSLCS